MSYEDKIYHNTKVIRNHFRRLYNLTRESNRDAKVILKEFQHKLKKIANLADIETPLTTYVSRHSWATIAKHSGIPTAIISEGLGHETEETTQIYLDSFDVEVLDKANEEIIS